MGSDRSKRSEEEKQAGDGDGHVSEDYLEEKAAMKAEYEADMRAEYEADMGDEHLADLPSAGEIADMKRSREEWMRRNVILERARRELASFDVGFEPIQLDELSALQAAIDGAEVEEDVQRFLTANRRLLRDTLAVGHRQYVIPKPKLGKDLIPDFLLAETHSMGIEWHGLELEPVSVRMFTAAGQASAKLTHAIQQVVDWREWLTNNIDQARRSQPESGLGLVGIDGTLSATILMGRREEYPEKFNAFRRQYQATSNISIHSYDWLVDIIKSGAQRSVLG